MPENLVFLKIRFQMYVYRYAVWIRFCKITYIWRILIENGHDICFRAAPPAIKHYNVRLSVHRATQGERIHVDKLRK